MKLGEGGEAFFVFETSDDIPEALQTSPLVSPVLSPKSQLEQGQASPGLQEPEYLDLDSQTRKHRPSSHSNPDMPASWLLEERRTQSYTGKVCQPIPLVVVNLARHFDTAFKLPGACD